MQSLVTVNTDTRNVQLIIILNSKIKQVGVGDQVGNKMNKI